MLQTLIRRALQQLVLLGLICLSSTLYASRLDSLAQVFQSSEDDSLKLAVNNQLIWGYLFQDQDKAWELIEVSKQLAEKPDQEFGYISLLNIIGVYYDITGEPDSGLYYFEKVLVESRRLQIEVHEEHALNNLGLYFWNRGKLNKALDYFLASKEINEKLNGKDNAKQDGLLNNIGLLYQEQYLYREALHYHLKAYAIRSALAPRPPLMASLNNLGICYKELGQLDSAQFYLQKGIALREACGDEAAYYRLSSTLTGCYYIDGRIREALDLANTSIARPEEVPYNDLDKARDYNNLAQLYVRDNKADSSLYFGKKAQEIIEADSEMIRLIPEIYLAMANAHLLQQNFEESSRFNELYLKAIEKAFNQESTERFRELELQYETAKKEQELAESKLALAEKTEQRNLILFFAIVGLLILILFFNNQRLRNKRLRAEVELKAAMMRVEAQNQLQEQRIEISRNLHDTLGAQLTFIISAIDNLRIFDLSKDKLTLKYDQLSEFTRTAIYELRDTIWAMNKEQITYEDLKGRISNFVQQAKTSVPLTQFAFHYPEHSPFVFSSKKGMEVFRIIQEAVNNAIKHAEANEIKIDMLEELEYLSVEISDNGQGFNPDEEQKGVGMSTMQKRAESIGGNIRWESGQRGTLVHLRIQKGAL